MPANIFWPNSRGVLDYNKQWFQHQDTKNVSTSVWMVSADEIFSQDIENSDYQKFSRCLSVETTLDQDIKSDTNGSLTTGGCISAGDTIIVMPIGPYVPLLKTTLGNTTKINTIITMRCSMVNTVVIPLQTITYETCYLTKVHQINDNLEFHFRFTKFEEQYAVLTQDGSGNGSKGGSLDFSKYNFKIQ